jgi:hypothetical protein
MPLRAGLLSDISARLTAISGMNLITSSAVYDIYEAYVFSLVIAAAVRGNASISFEDNSETATTNLIFRTSPGNIYPPATTPSVRYTHAIISFPNKPQIELHQGIYVSGRSGQVHECDIAAIFRSEGRTCRTARVIWPMVYKGQCASRTASSGNFGGDGHAPSPFG